MTGSEFDTIPLTGWFPGHMLKAGREMQQRLELVDVVVQILDARIPRASRNPAIEAACTHKPQLLVFNKADLAAPALTRRWEAWFAAGSIPALFVDGRTGGGAARLLPAARQLWEAERRRRGATRPLLRGLRLMIAGVPNVGKSTLINRLAERHKAAVGPKPGVTRATQWIRLQDGMEMLDTPGVFFPHLECKQDELLLGLAGCIKDEVIGEELLAEYLWFRLAQAPPPAATRWERYGLAAPPASADELLAAVAKRRGLFRAAAASFDRRQSAIHLLLDYREGKLGRFTFDEPADASPPG
ncbi:MAG: ribosome biogenesis GTPase YlqF [Lentisphaeria bacterium]|jgi:ribosome biogenesis GTPase A